MTARYWLGFSLIAASAIWIQHPLLFGPPTSDSWMGVWAGSQLHWWNVFSDPLEAGYVYIPMLEPFFLLSHIFGNALAPYLGNFAYHFLGLAGLLLAADRLARLLWWATSSTTIALAAATLFLTSPPAWFAIGETTSYHFTLATWLALCSIEPSWRAYVSGKQLGRFTPLWSALAYALGLALKPSVAGIGLLIVALLIAAGWRLIDAIKFVLPHSVVLISLLIWQKYIIGGFGGYPFAPNFVWSNFLTAPLALSSVSWGSMLIVPLLAAIAVVFRPRSIWLWAVVAVASLSPYLFAYPLEADGYATAKLLLLLALFLLLVGWSVARAGSLLFVAAAAALIVLQVPRYRPMVHEPIEAMARDETDYRTTRDPLVVLPPRGFFIAYGFGHQLQPEPKGTLLAFFSPEATQLYRAVEGEFPAGARVVGVPDLPRVGVVPLSLDGIEFGADRTGHFHVTVADGGTGELWQAFYYQNGKTRFLYAWPIARAHAVLPLNYSIRFVFLFRPTSAGPWQVHRWDSPWFRDPYPPAENQEQPNAMR